MRMTSNRRIFLNIVASYARSAYVLFLGLITARWLLLSLGTVDYGLLGVVGGLISFVTFLNSLFSSSVSRFYAISIGKAMRNQSEGLSESRRWFTVAFSIHSIIPFFLVVVGIPSGIWVVDHILVIPADRLSACHWVWIFTCISAYVGMVNVPFRAMYTAKQEIAELTILNVADATLNAVLLGYMISHPGDWLAKYVGIHCLMAILLRVLICVRAIIVFPECRFVKGAFFCWTDIRKLATFAYWNAFGSLSQMIRTKGCTVLVNRFLGVTQNAAIIVGVRLAARTNTFSQSLITSFSPAIVSAYGAGQHNRMRRLARRVSKLGAMVVMFFSVPMLMEAAEVMRLWLKKPPTGSAFLCSCVLCVAFLNKITAGERIAIGASGKLAAYQMGVCVANAVALAAAYVMLRQGYGIEIIGYNAVFLGVFNVFQRVYYAQRCAGLSIVEWIRRVALPISVVALIGVGVAYIPHLFLDPCFLRVLLTVAIGELVLVPLTWFWVIDDEEKQYIREKSSKVLRFCRLHCGYGTKML